MIKIPHQYLKKGYSLLSNEHLFTSTLEFDSKEEDRDDLENLSKYLDVVEISLFKKTTNKAENFFSILTDIEKLTNQIQESKNLASSLAESLQVVNQREKLPLEVLRLQNEKERVEEMKTVLLQILRLKEIDELLLNLFDKGNANIFELTELVKEFQTNLENMKQFGLLMCLTEMQKRLEKFKGLIFDLLKTSFFHKVSCLSNYSYLSSKEILDYTNQTKSLLETLDSNFLAKIIIEFEETGLTDLKSLVKQTIISFLFIDFKNANDQNELQKLQELSPSEFLDLLSKVLDNISGFLDNVEIIYEMLPFSKTDFYEIAEKSVGQILSVQSDLVFLDGRLLDTCFTFTKEKEKFGIKFEKMEDILQEKIHRAVKNWFQSFNSVLGVTLKKEAWRQVEVPSFIQHMYNLQSEHVGSVTMRLDKLVLEKKNKENIVLIVHERQVKDLETASKKLGATTKRKVRKEVLSIETRDSYKCVGSVYLLIFAIFRYKLFTQHFLQFKEVAQTVTVEINRSISKYSDSIRKLILGAEATKSGILKRINAKHLALASISILCPLHLLQGDGNLLKGEKKLNEHRLSLQGKFAELVRLLFNSLAAKDKNHVEELFTNLLGGIKSMHSTLARVYGTQKLIFELRETFKKVFDMLDTLVINLIEKYDVSDVHLRSKLRVQLSQFVSELRRLRNIDSPSEAMENALKESIQREADKKGAAEIRETLDSIIETILKANED
eukprot:snap_masked-scaffold_94-processed-gene-0.19-mRNA-1 protein AED:1.00 eAED:1.00 QI:0/-1/0/0/-1/1/1/0/724